MAELPTIDHLYRETWQHLSIERQAIAELDREGTPVLAFGRWQTSKVVTAGLNPSEIEFRDRQGRGLADTSQRFLHWPADSQLTEERFALARERAENYFTLGNAYTRWFDLYTAFLDGIGVSFKDGTACHTDYVSPFATDKGIGRCSADVRSRLASYGQSLWVRVLSAMPNVQIVFGHGAGWHTMPGLLNFGHWEPVPTGFDNKGGKVKMSRPYLLFARASHPSQSRTIGVYWWKPNRDGSPLTWLNAAERAQLGTFVRTHAVQQGVWSDH